MSPKWAEMRKTGVTAVQFYGSSHNEKSTEPPKIASDALLHIIEEV